jgi:hypothetical protein
MILYVGPDQLIPLSGALGTLAGLAMIFWGKLTHLWRKIATRLTSKARE